MSISAGERRHAESAVFSMRHVSKRYRRASALDDVTIEVMPGEIVGLVGRNGCGKTTLLQHVAGLIVQTEGECRTFGVPTDAMGAPQVERLGFMPQHPKLLDWMRVRRLLQYVSGFYPSWDRLLEARLTERLDIDVDAVVRELSPGNRQKLALVMSLCHRPDLLLLDEPLSDLDPIARKDVLAILLEQYAADGPAMVLSSHLLHDIEPIIARVVCLDAGRIATDAALDDLKESFESWHITARDRVLPSAWNEPWVVQAEGDQFAARLTVRRTPGLAQSMAASLDAEIAVSALNLEQLFPLLVRGTTSDA